MFDIIAARTTDTKPVETLLDKAFGADRHNKRSYHFVTAWMTFQAFALSPFWMGTCAEQSGFGPFQLVLRPRLCC